MIDSVSSQDEIMSSWFGRGNGRCQIGWLGEPLLLLFYANTPGGEAIGGGDPLTGATYEVLNLTGVNGILFRVQGRRIGSLEHDAVRHVEVPGQIIREDLMLAQGRALEMGFELPKRRCVVREDVVVIPNRNVSVRLLPSPVGRGGGYLKNRICSPMRGIGRRPHLMAS